MESARHTGGQRDPVNIVEGRVTESLPNTLFRVALTAPVTPSDSNARGLGADENGDEKGMLAYLSGNMRLHRIRVLVGDKVLVKLDPYGGKGRITKRL